VCNWNLRVVAKAVNSVETLNRNASVLTPLNAATDAQALVKTPSDSVTQLQSSSSTDSRVLPQNLQQVVSECLGDSFQAVEHYLQQSLVSQYHCVNALTEQVRSMAGKRLRPILVLLSARVCCGTDINPQVENHKRLTQMAVSVELVHMASLVHDDLMDQAATRRHQSTIHQSAGSNSAILLGDYLFAQAYRIASECKHTLPARKLALAATRLCEGELRQQLSAGCVDYSLADYFSLIEQKTAALCAVSCQLGAWHAKGSRLQQAALRRFGRYLGMAFQVFDDWLDYWGTQSTGKTLGTDLLQLKPTYPLIKFLQTAPIQAAQQLRQLLSQPTPASLSRAHELICNSSANQQTRAAAQRLATKALMQLSLFEKSPTLAALKSLASFSVSRTS
jgi:octaprenyl-diphosphate synthase